MQHVEELKFLETLPTTSRVLIVFTGQRGAGIPYSLGCAQLLLNHGARVDMLVSSVVMDPIFRIPKGVGEVFEFEAAQSPMRKLLACSQTLRRVKKHITEPYDAAIVVMESPYSSVVLALLGRHHLCHRRVLTIHDVTVHPGDIISRVGQCFHALAQLWSSEIVAPSQYTANRLRLEYQAKKRVSTMPINAVHGAAVGLLSPDAGENWRAPKSTPPNARINTVRFVMVGRLMAYKGTSMLTEVLARLDEASGKAGTPNWTLNIAGAGFSRDEAKRLQTQEPRVRIFNQWMDWSAYYGRLASADCVLCIHTEASQSGLVADAIAMQRALVLTNVGGLPEQAAGYHRAYLAQPNPESIADQMLRALQDLV